jgi:hypothetical protein
MPLTGACHRRCRHRELVQAYRDWRISWEERREDEFHMRLEDDEYAAMFPPPTFKAWLEAGRC